jgi:polyisoprenoid-binding protein YceI
MRILSPLKSVVLSSLTLLIAVPVLAAHYKVDSVHSNVGFSIRHLMISTVRGKFTDFGGEFSFDPKTSELSAKDFVAKTASVDTDNAKRDGHLKDKDFFDAAECPEIKVSNSKVKKTGDKAYEWTGDLTMHCVTKPVKFSVEYIGEIKDKDSGNRVGFEAKAKIKRSDWGLKYNKVLEAGGVAISDEVAIEINVEAIEQTAKK